VLHNPSLWTLIVLVGAFGLLLDTALRSWRFPGRVDDWGWFTGSPAPAILPHPIGPEPVRPYTGDGATRRELVLYEWRGDYLELPAPRVEQCDARELGATEEWSPIAEVAGAGRSLEDWLSERLQQYDDALHRIESALRMPDGSVWHAPMSAPWPYIPLTTDNNLQQFIDGSQQLHAYRELRIGGTGEFTARDHMDLEERLFAESRERAAEAWRATVV